MVHGIPESVCYGYRVAGKDSRRIVADPYSRDLYGRKKWGSHDEAKALNCLNVHRTVLRHDDSFDW